MVQGKALTPEEKKAIVALKEYFDRTIDDLEEQGRIKCAKGVKCAWVWFSDGEKDYGRLQPWCKL